MALRSRLLVVLAVLFLIAAACSSDDGDDTTTTADTGGDTTTTEAMSDDPIIFASSLPLTGEFSGVGAKHADGYQFCIDEINARGGILGRPAELIVEDNRSETEVAVAQYERFINVDNADILFGTFSSLLGYPTSSIAEQNGIDDPTRLERGTVLGIPVLPD